MRSPGRTALAAQAPGNALAVKNASMLHTQSPSQKAVTVEVHTPVARQLMACTPPRAAQEPQAGCSIEELRVFILEQLHVVKADSHDLEVRAAVEINQVQGKIDDLAARTNAVLNDVGVFGG